MLHRGTKFSGSVGVVLDTGIHFCRGLSMHCGLSASLLKPSVLLQGDASKSDSEGDLFPRSLEEEGGLKKNLSNPACE